ncbi:putative disease resistance protein RGA1 [Phragmites australis]|uniref:putative disease resistance protein RGA1 n=1 Tax=Phragmites australis TaxID=29695 RepID=UPI002D791297|nr:putative disease resistance protein RGA1 [Phragmites australis]
MTKSFQRELEGETVSDGPPERKLCKDDISRRITIIVDQLHEICEDVRKALKQDKIDEITRATHSTSSDLREEGACYIETKIFAREEEKNKNVKLITNSSASNQKLLVLPIIGNGGVGKTTFARLVYNDPEVKDKFDFRIWIYVSVIFDEVKLTEEILECISEGKHTSMTKNLSMLQDGIKKCLTKRFLLVLDDVWEENERRWDKLLAPLRCTEITGNVVFVTTRIKSVTKMTSIMEQHINLGGLNKDVFWLFFKRCIFGDENYQGRRKLQKIGKEIATRLRGNPLAAKSVSTLLKRRLEESYWQRISDGDEWKLQGDNDDIMPALMLSYNHLPYHLQRLFSYCALFPKGYKFNKEQLIHIWIALGFIVDERKRPEDSGSDYFDDSVDRSFFEKIESQEYAYYLMHDLIHDLAQSVSINECLTVDGSGPLTVYPYVSHISIWMEAAYKKEQNGDIEHNETFEKGLTSIQNDDILRNLDSLMLVGSYDRTFSVIFAKILRQLKHVRVLRLSAMFFNADIFQSSIANFIHLRYLELRSTEDTLKCLPKSLCRLYHLQVLDVRHWCGLNDLPRDMCNLVNLRYLIVPESGALHLHSKIVRVGELKFLQELKEFHVQTESGFEISQLENLNEIRGSLGIFNLDNVIKKDEASCARIKDKKHLRTLSLSWGRTNCNFPKQILEDLYRRLYIPQVLRRKWDDWRHDWVYVDVSPHDRLALPEAVAEPQRSIWEAAPAEDERMRPVLNRIDYLRQVGLTSVMVVADYLTQIGEDGDLDEGALVGLLRVVTDVEDLTRAALPQEQLALCADPSRVALQATLPEFDAQGLVDRLGRRNPGTIQIPGVDEETGGARRTGGEDATGGREATGDRTQAGGRGASGGRPQAGRGATAGERAQLEADRAALVEERGCLEEVGLLLEAYIASARATHERAMRAVAEEREALEEVRKEFIAAQEEATHLGEISWRLAAKLLARERLVRAQEEAIVQRDKAVETTRADLARRNDELERSHAEVLRRDEVAVRETDIEITVTTQEAREEQLTLHEEEAATASVALTAREEHAAK